MLGLGISLLKRIINTVSIVVTKFYITKEGDTYGTASGDTYIHGGTN